MSRVPFVPVVSEFVPEKFVPKSGTNYRPARTFSVLARGKFVPEEFVPEESSGTNYPSKISDLNSCRRAYILYMGTCFRHEPKCPYQRRRASRISDRSRP